MSGATRSPHPVIINRGPRLDELEQLSPDPQRQAILSRIRLAWRDVPPGGMFGFFDVQPITVKAYGGRRYTAARRLVLERRQRTRGRFYLFVLYEVATGRVHWQCCPGKGAADVCRFMQRVRQWYPAAEVPEVWVVLDQDPAHPLRASETRRLMRALGLHWISLPKARPDDNPAEVILSDIQLLVLDNSNDPDARTTQRRISAHLRRRNRRHDSHIRIHYLAEMPKG